MSENESPDSAATPIEAIETDPPTPETPPPPQKSGLDSLLPAIQAIGFQEAVIVAVNPQKTPPEMTIVSNALGQNVILLLTEAALVVQRNLFRPTNTGQSNGPALVPTKRV